MDATTAAALLAAVAAPIAAGGGIFGAVKGYQANKGQLGFDYLKLAIDTAKADVVRLTGELDAERRERRTEAAEFRRDLRKCRRDRDAALRALAQHGNGGPDAG